MLNFHNILMPVNRTDRQHRIAALIESVGVCGYDDLADSLE